MRMSSGHGQPLLKTGWEAEGCLQDVVRVCMVLGKKIPDPLVSTQLFTPPDLAMKLLILEVIDQAINFCGECVGAVLHGCNDLTRL